MSLVIHSLNVGAGDCTIVQFHIGRIGMIDLFTDMQFDDTTKEDIMREQLNASISMAEYQSLSREQRSKFEQILEEERNKLTNPLDYYYEKFRTHPIFRLIITHPHMDHMDGLNQLVNGNLSPSINNFWHIGPYDFGLDSRFDEGKFNIDDWRCYKLLRDNPPNGITSLNMSAGDKNQFWDEDGIDILYPTYKAKQGITNSSNANDCSMVLMITYKRHKIVLGGDATESTWDKILDSLQVDISGVTILRASHHGRESGFNKKAVELMKPQLVITSLYGKDVKYGADSEYNKIAKEVLSLRKTGNITLTIGNDEKATYERQF